MDDGYTEIPGALEEYFACAASWKPANGREVFENQGVEAKMGGTFWVRWCSETSGIVETDLIAFEGRNWDIVGIQEVKRRETLELIVVAGDEVES